MGIMLRISRFCAPITKCKISRILTNTHTLLFLKQNKIDKEEVRRNFDITEGELNIIFGNPAKGKVY